MGPPADFEGVARAEVQRERPEAIRVWLLGGFRVSVGSRTVEGDAWRLRKALILVKVLALAPGHRLHREQAMDLLWPDLGTRAASNNLRQVLHGARRILDPTLDSHNRYLSLQDEQLALCPGGDLRVDVDAFEEAVVVARRSRDPTAYRAAIELYAGDLLPEDRYEAWAEERREQLRRTFLELLLELAGLYERSSNWETAIQASRRVLEADPHWEEAHVSLMRLNALSGRSAEALTQYGALEEALRRVGAEPSASSRALRDEIALGTFVAAPAEDRRGHPLHERAHAAAGNHNLPAPRDSFVGREREIVEVKRTLAMTRLLTLTGAGGSGKTRLALEIARDLVATYPDGVWMVELAPLSEPELVAQEVAGALGVAERPGESLTDTLVNALSDKGLLLVLDNCEHLVEAAARLTDTLLSSCPHLRVLATSREPLGVGGEVIWRVPPLSLPDQIDGELDGESALESLVRYEAVRLFVDRARLRLLDFKLTQDNAGAVLRVCLKLEGIPLAIELATARMGALAVEQVAQRLEVSLDLLKGATRTAAPRQQTLRATLDWSYDLLSDAEQTLFGRLSVFAGGWTLEAAEGVCSAGIIEQEETLDLLGGLVDKSLVVAEGRTEGAVRYSMLEPIRQYAREILEESGQAEALRRRHAEYFLALVRETEPKLRGPKENAWLNCLELEHDNVRTALSWSLGGHDSGLGLRLAAAFWKFWDARSYLSEGSAWLREALAKGSDAAGPSVKAAALHGLGIIVGDLGDFEQAERCHEEVLVLYKQLEDSTGVAESFNRLGWLAIWQGYAGRAASLFEAGLAAAREAENQVALRRAINGLAVIAFDAGEPERARRLWEEALEFDREQGSDFGAAMILTTMGFADIAIGDYERSVELLEEALALGHKLNSRELLAGCLLCLGLATTLLDRPEQAKPMLRESLEIEMAREAKANIAENLDALATMAGALVQHVRAARLWGAAEMLREATGVVWGLAERMVYQPPRDDARVRLGAAAWEKEFAQGKAMSLETVFEYALSDEETTTPAPEQLSSGDRPPVLTRRQEEVAAFVARGPTNRQLASELHVSEHTAATHVSKILKKLGLQSRAQIGTWLAEHPPERSEETGAWGS